MVPSATHARPNHDAASIGHQAWELVPIDVATITAHSVCGSFSEGTSTAGMLSQERILRPIYHGQYRGQW